MVANMNPMSNDAIHLYTNFDAVDFLFVSRRRSVTERQGDNEDRGPRAWGPESVRVCVFHSNTFCETERLLTSLGDVFVNYKGGPADASR